MWFLCNGISPKVKGRMLVVALGVSLSVIFYYYVSILSIFTKTTGSPRTFTVTPRPTRRPKDAKVGEEPDLKVGGHDRLTFAEADFNVRGDMGNIDVVSGLRENFLVPPSPPDVPYNLTAPDIPDPSMVQAFLVERILNGKRHGFFVECGALDGEYGSNTLMFERDYNWTGVLIESSPLAYSRLAAKNRKAYISPTCLSKSTKQEMAMFENGVLHRVDDDDFQDERDNKMATNETFFNEKPRNTTNATEVHCFPLYSYLLAVNHRVVDYLSLNVEGSELDVLKTIPWARVVIRTLSVAFFPLGKDKDALRTYMEGVGYYVHSEIKMGSNHIDNYVFVTRNISP